jgi:hypothetical protein
MVATLKCLANIFAKRVSELVQKMGWDDQVVKRIAGAGLALSQCRVISY